ncbi:SEC10/PgrA surface exclusion domain-containing protein, partial [Ligilactobacillus salivarius]|uniref:SEC10/PgrA surface exclusion domain-containing protein n=1 Tax=Ligilactobacillus salivarius TaxID=1624 RepID=UPI003F8AE3D6
LVQALKDYEKQGNSAVNAIYGYDDNATEIKLLKQKWLDVMTDSSKIIDWKDNNESDQNTALDPNNLTAEQATDLSNFVATIINQMRVSLGINNDVGDVLVSKGSVQLALTVAKNTFNDKWAYVDHDRKALNKAFSEFGINGGGAEDASWNSGDFFAKPTIASFKNDIFYAIQQMMFEDGDQDMGHTISLLGLINVSNSDKPSYLGVGTNYLYDDEGNVSDVSMFHYNIVDPLAYLDDINTDSTVLKSKGMFDTVNNPYTDLANALKQAQGELSNLQNQLSTAQNDLKTSQDNLATQQGSLTAQESKLNDLQKQLSAAQTKLSNDNINLNSLKSSLKQAQTKLSLDQTVLQQAKQALDNYNADAKVKLANLKQAQDNLKAEQERLNDANTTLAEKQTAYDNAQSELKQAQASQAKAQADYENAQNELAKSQTKLASLQADLKQAQDKLVKDTETLKQAQNTLNVYTQDNAQKLANLKQAQDNLKAEQDKLADLKNVVDGKKATLSEKQTTLSDAQEVLKAAQDSLKAEQDKLNSLQQHLSDLENAPKLLVEAQDRLAKAKETLAKAQADYEDAVSTLSDKQATLKEKQDALEKAQTALSQAKQVLASLQAIKYAEDKAKAQAEEKAKNTHFAQTANGKIVNSKGHIMVGYTVKGNQVFDAQGKLVGTLAQTSTTRRMANTVKQENTKALPQTGNKQNNNTTVGAILVGLGSLLGLGALGKRKED